VAEPRVKDVSALANAFSGSSVAAGQVLCERVRTDRTSSARGVRCSRYVAEICTRTQHCLIWWPRL